MEALAELPIEQLRELAVQVLEMLEAAPAVGRGGKTAQPWTGGLERKTGMPEALPGRMYGMGLGAAVEMAAQGEVRWPREALASLELAEMAGTGLSTMPLRPRRTGDTGMWEAEAEGESGVPTRRADRRTEDRSVRQDAEAISAFLRRDSRRYDAGFVHY